MKNFTIIQIGEHFVRNPHPNDPPYLSAGSGVTWDARGGRLRTVGDDQATFAEFDLAWADVQDALRLGKIRQDLLAPGWVQRIIPTVLPPQGSARKEAKADFEAMTVIKPRDIAAIGDQDVRSELARRFPWGLMLIIGSGGMSWGGVRRSIGVVYALGADGRVMGLPSEISFEGLHAWLEHEVIGVNEALNIEGVCVHGNDLVLAQRGNSRDQNKRPMPNMLIRLSLVEVLTSLWTDLKVDQCELVAPPLHYELGHRDLDGHKVKLDFTDIDSVHEDPEQRIIFTAAAEDLDTGEIAGSIVGVIGGDFVMKDCWPLADSTIKLEGVDARYNRTTGGIDLLLVPDADDPLVPAPLFAARISE